VARRRAGYEHQMPARRLRPCHSNVVGGAHEGGRKAGAAAITKVNATSTRACLGLNSVPVAKAFGTRDAAAAGARRLAPSITARHARSVRRAPAWPGGDQDERERLRGVCDRANAVGSTRARASSRNQSRGIRTHGAAAASARSRYSSTDRRTRDRGARSLFARPARKGVNPVHVREGIWKA